MKSLKKFLSITAILFTATAVTLFMGGPALAQGGMGYGSNGSSGGGSGISTITNLPYQVPDDTELEGLVKMREEEKLARDVYLTLGDLWSSPVFSNIARSEQKHMDALKTLFDKYDLIDPVTYDTIGIFNDPDFTELYDNLVTQGNGSIENALLVGATIEDLDIFDLNLLIQETDNDDMLVVYQNLVKGSRNHLRAFTSMLAQYNIIYEPQFLSQEAFDLIISSDKEFGRYDKEGNSASGGNNGKSMGMNSSQSFIGYPLKAGQPLKSSVLAALILGVKS